MKTIIPFILVLVVLLMMGTSTAEGQDQSQVNETIISKEDSPLATPDLVEIIPLPTRYQRCTSKYRSRE